MDKPKRKRHYTDYRKVIRWLKSHTVRAKKAVKKNVKPND